MKLELSERRERETTREYALRILSMNILRLRLVPGTALSEQEIAGELNVSRTPVREAFIHLAEESLLKIMPQRGTYVARINLGHVQESIFLRGKMEHAVMELACAAPFSTEVMEQLQRSLIQQRFFLQQEDFISFFEQDRVFHGMIYEACQKGRIWKMLVQNSQNYNRVRMLSLLNGDFEMSKLIEQHEEIVEAIVKSDWNRGAKVIDRHTHKVIPDLEKLEEKYPDYFEE